MLLCRVRFGRLAILVGLLAAVAASAGAAGCYAARVDGMERGAHEGEVLVRCRVWGLWPYEKDCRLVAESYGYAAQGRLGMTRDVPQPEYLMSSVRTWTRAAPDPSLPPDLVRVRFYYEDEVLDERHFPVPIWWGEVVGRMRPAPAPAPGPIASGGGGGGGEGGDGADSGSTRRGHRLSPDVDLPTEHDIAKVLVCTVDVATTPQYARIRPPAGPLRVVIDARNHGDPRKREKTWWRVDLLDERGVAAGASRSAEVGSGDETRTVDVWRFDGRPHILKISSGSEPGDTLQVRYEPE